MSSVPPLTLELKRENVNFVSDKEAIVIMGLRLVSFQYEIVGSKYYFHNDNYGRVLVIWQ